MVKNGQILIKMEGLSIELDYSGFIFQTKHSFNFKWKPVCTDSKVNHIQWTWVNSRFFLS